MVTVSVCKCVFSRAYLENHNVHTIDATNITFLYLSLSLFLAPSMLSGPSELNKFFILFVCGSLFSSLSSRFAPLLLWMARIREPFPYLSMQVTLARERDGKRVRVE